jgi:hypothetical protein
MHVRPKSKPRLQAGLLLAFVAIGGAVPAAASASRSTAGPSRTAVERDVLRVLGRLWNPRLMPELVDPRTRLARNNVQAVCRRRRVAPAADSGSFTCVVRPGDPRSRVRLYLSYRTVATGGFVVHWVDLLRR